jgi:hypothetical protein
MEFFTSNSAMYAAFAAAEGNDLNLLTIASFSDSAFCGLGNVATNWSLILMTDRTKPYFDSWRTAISYLIYLSLFVIDESSIENQRDISLTGKNINDLRRKIKFFKFMILLGFI